MPVEYAAPEEDEMDKSLEEHDDCSASNTSTIDLVLDENEELREEVNRLKLKLELE